jgi:uncharacterized protein
LKVLKKYNISIAHLENGSFSFAMNGDDEFFKYYELETIESGSFKAQIELIKSETMLNVHFVIDGILRLICDRSLEEFDFPFKTEESIILKFGDHEEELASGIKVINRTTQQINVAQDIFELISLAVPMKKLHPRFLTEEYDENEGFVVYSTIKDDEIQEKETNIDPRWAALKNLK